MSESTPAVPSVRVRLRDALDAVPAYVAGRPAVAQAGMIAEELELAGGMGVGELRQKEPPEQP